MKKIKLLTLGLLTLIGLGSFCNAEIFEFSGSVSGDSMSTNTVVFSYSVPMQYKIGDSLSGGNLYCKTTGNVNGYLYIYSKNDTSSKTFTLNGGGTFNRNLNYDILSFYLRSNSDFTNYSLDYYCRFTTYGDFYGGCDYSDYVPLSDYNTCLSDLNTATGNYLSCQSSISGYLNSLNNCSSNLNSCNTSLSSCLSANCPNNTGNISRSALFINNIQHIGAPVIRMTIPEELSWDYAYTDSGNNMEIDIEGYNVDYDKINNIVDIQSYKPTDEDFSNIIGLLADYMPILIIFVGLIFIYKFLTKSFKSKL